ncbi:hypothetical protein SteCoe_35671 [Stentor coeruleus]|uniref:Protein kinase domain-containing protein n=1 Tax=Stentor coeruleus TaxID=5963 RepID=A0A1R2ARU5_9CILI|nr:hypothetical protein SteCoe_35671 [Stentor coeruleus]
MESEISTNEFINFFLEGKITEEVLYSYFEEIEMAPCWKLSFYKDIFIKIILDTSIEVLLMLKNIVEFDDRMELKELVNHTLLNNFFEVCIIIREEICYYNNRLVKVKLSYNDIEKYYLALINDFNVDANYDFEKYFSQFCPDFYVGCASRTEDQYFRKYVFFSLDYITTIDESVLNPHLLNFHKLPIQERKSLLTLRQKQAQDLYKSIVQQLKLCNTIFTRHYIKVYPKNILVYNDKNAPDKLCFVLIPYRFSYKRSDKDYSLQINLSEDENKRLMPPEYANPEYYRKSFPNKFGNSNVEKSEIWSASACALNMITDQHVDKWNNINFKKNLLSVVNKSISEEFSKLKNELLINLELDYDQRRNLNEAIENFP